MTYQDHRAEQILQQINEARRAVPPDPILDSRLPYGESTVTEAVLRLDFQIAHAGYWKRREEIWLQQITNGISGIIWVETEFCGKSTALPQLVKGLVLVPGDKNIITASKNEAIAWVKDATVGFKIWRTDNNHVVQYTWEDFLDVANGLEWVELSSNDSIVHISDTESKEEYDTPFLALNVRLCWGVPGHHFNLDITPGSGSILFQFTNEVVL